MPLKRFCIKDGASGKFPSVPVGQCTSEQLAQRKLQQVRLFTKLDERRWNTISNSLEIEFLLAFIERCRCQFRKTGFTRLQLAILFTKERMGNTSPCSSYPQSLSSVKVSVLEVLQVLKIAQTGTLTQQDKFIEQFQILLSRYKQTIQ